MKTIELAVTRIGNGRGVRIPAKVLRRYGIGKKILMEQRADEIALRPKWPRHRKFSWEQTYRQMAASDEDWSDWVNA